MIRLAKIEDINELKELIKESSRVLLQSCYSPEEIEAQIDNDWITLDEYLIHDKTLYVYDDGNEICACGAWCRRDREWGNREFSMANLLDKNKDPVYIRCFFTKPTHLRKGYARKILEICENEARTDGFKKAICGTTPLGLKFFSSCGYQIEETGDHKVEDTDYFVTYHELYKTL